MNCPLCGAEVDERYLCADLECAGSTEAFQLAYDAEGVAYLEEDNTKSEALKSVERWLKNWHKRLDEVLVDDKVARKYFDSPELADDVRAALVEIDKLEREATGFEVAYNARKAADIEFKKTATEDMRTMQERAKEADREAEDLRKVLGWSKDWRDIQLDWKKRAEKAEAERDGFKSERDFLYGRLDHQTNYSVALQRIIEDICHNREIRDDGLASHHTKMARKFQTL